MTKVRSFVLCLAMMICAYGFADEPDADQIFEKVVSTYKSMQTHKAQGTIISDIDAGEMQMNAETSFSILLKKPNLYHISWTQKNMPMPGMIQSGAVWSDGTQPHLYMGVMNAYSTMSTDELALGAATGISGGAAFTIPSIFLAVFEEQPAAFARLVDPKIVKTEKVGEEDCYVISGASTISKNETFWISKSKYHILKFSRSFEPPEEGLALPEMTDEELEQTIKAMGQEVTEENKKSMREMMNGSRDAFKTMKIRGSSTELHVKISSPQMSKKDFQFAVPEGTVLKESLFGGLLGGGSKSSNRSMTNDKQ